jgi:hypothetical protein
MTCQWMVVPVSMEFGIPRDRITVIPNFVDTRRFSHVRRPPDRLRRALLFGNHPFPEDEMQSLERACGVAGLSLEKIGLGHLNPQPRPELFLPEYDVVFAIGRCALEAIACGCAVITIIPGQAGELVTKENFDNWVYSNFSPRYYSCADRVNEEWLLKQLQKYSAENAAEVTARVRNNYNLAQAVGKLEKIYRETVDNFDYGTIKMPAEFAIYLERLSSDVDRMWEGQPLNHLSLPIDTAGQKIDSVSQKIDSVRHEMIDTAGQKIDTVSQKIDSVDQKIDTVRREMNGLAAAFSEALYRNRSLGARLGSGLSLLYRRILPARIREPLYRVRQRVLTSLMQ